MRRIGTTGDGRILLEATPEELLTVDAAIETLMEWRAMCAVQALAPASTPPSPVAPRTTPAAAKVCKIGGADRAFAPRPLVTNEEARTKRMARSQDEALRERDERLDRPISNGRVQPVGMQD